MSSNIRINRICEECKTEFVAKTTRTRFCSVKCNGKSNKTAIKNLKIEKSNSDVKALKNSEIVKTTIDVNNKDFLTVKDASMLLNISSKTIYRLIARNELNAFNFSERKTLIRRRDIDLCFDNSLKNITENTNNEINDINFENSYTIQEIEEKYLISPSALYNLLIRFKIPKRKQGKYTLVQKKDIDAIFN